MSAERWESVTWDWLEREIADYLLIASRHPERPKSFAGLLAKRLEAPSVPRKEAKRHRRSSSNA